MRRWLQMLETPLSRSAHNGHLQTVRHLLDEGADVNCLDLVCSLNNILLYLVPGQDAQIVKTKFTAACQD